MSYPVVPLFKSRIRVIDSDADTVARVQVPSGAEPGPPPIPGGRPKGSKQPHTNANRRPRRPLFGPTRTGQDWIDRDTAIRKALTQMRYGGVNIDRIPDEAMALLEEAHTPPERDHWAFKPRGKRRRV
jgi:hypothetical protein